MSKNKRKDLEEEDLEEEEEDFDEEEDDEDEEDDDDYEEVLLNHIKLQQIYFSNIFKKNSLEIIRERSTITGK